MSSVALLEAYGMDQEFWLVKTDYRSEYLSQGRVKIPAGAMTTTTLEDLEEYGLYGFYPRFNDAGAKRQLISRINELRFELFFTSLPQVPTSEEVKLAAAIAEGYCSDGRFRTVLFTSLMALKPRIRKEMAILEEFVKHNWREFPRQRCFNQQANLF